MMIIRTKDTRGRAVVGLVMTVLMVSAFAGCLDNNDGKPSLVQTGSSTVLPLAVVWAEEYEEADISVSGGGSSHGLNSLLLGEADLGDASRLMKGSDYGKVGCPETDVDGETGTALSACGGVMPHKWVMAYDVLAVVVNNDNTWAGELNYSQLYEIFTDDSPAMYWDEVMGLNESGAPHERIEIYAPDEASGTYDYFFESIIPDWGKDTQAANARLDADDGVYHPSADDNVILNAIEANEYAIGYFGFAYYKENMGDVKAVALGEDDVHVIPSLSNVATYPMSRPLYIYTDDNADNREVVSDFLGYALGGEGQSLVPEVGYVKLELVDPALASSQLGEL